MTRQEIISALDQALEKTLAGAEAMSDKDKKVYFDDLNRIITALTESKILSSVPETVTSCEQILRLPQINGLASALAGVLDKDNFFNFGEYLINELNPKKKETRRLIYAWLDLFRKSSFLRKIYDEQRWPGLIEKMVRESNLTLAQLFKQRTLDYNEKVLFRVFEGIVSKDFTWKHIEQRVHKFAKALALLALEGRQEAHKVAFLMENSLDMVCLDLACLTHGIVNIMMPANSVPAQIEFIFNQTEAGIILVSDDKQLAKIKSIKSKLPMLKKAVLLKGSSIEEWVLSMDDFLDAGEPFPKEQLMQMQKNIRIDELATIMYTSGTTGDPKGIMFSNMNIVYKRFCRAMALPEIGDEDRFLSYLPLYHTFGRWFEMTGAIFWGAQYIFMENPALSTMLDNMQRAQPTIFISIPKKWIQLYEYVTSQVNVQTDEDDIIGQALKQASGGSLRWGLSAAGYLEPDIFRFFRRYGITLMSGFGMTEATGGITMTDPDVYVDNSLGRPLPGIRAKLAEDGEMLIQGPYVMMGYYGMPPGQSVFTDGWFPTGDIMRLDENGYFEIIDRKKQIYKNIKGETIAPAKIENFFNDFEAVEQVFLVGDHKPFNTVLIYPNYAFSGQVIKKMNPQEMQNYFASVIVSVNKFLAPFERILDFKIIDRPFRAELGELTPKGTYKRRVIEKNFHETIEQLYTKNYISLKNRELELRVPSWFLREKGCLIGDIAFDEEGLHISKFGAMLAIHKISGSLCRIGDYIYANDKAYLDFQIFLANPFYWLGNVQLMEFAGESIFQWYRIDDPQPEIRFDAVQETAPLSAQEKKSFQHILDGKEKSLFGLNYAVRHLHSQEQEYALKGVNYLRLILQEDHLPIYNLAREIVCQPQFGQSPEIRRKLFLAGLPLFKGRHLQKYLALYLARDQLFLNEEISKKIVDLHRTEDDLAAIHAVLKSELSRLDEAHHLKETPLPSLLNLLAEFGVRHPARYKRIRQMIVRHQLDKRYRHLSVAASIARRKLLKGFREWLGEKQLVSVDVETGEEYQWSDVIIFEEDISAQDKRKLLQAFTETSLLREAIFIFSGGNMVRLYDIPPGGIWISLLQDAEDKAVFRVAVQTRYRGSYDFVINLSREAVDDNTREKMNWLIHAGAPAKGLRLIEDFGGFWENFNLWTEDFYSGDTVARFFERSLRKDTEENRSRLAHIWPFFVRTAITAHVNFWRRTGYRLELEDKSINNIMIPPHDYQMGMRLVSIAKRKETESLGALLADFCQKFVHETENKYPFLKQEKDFFYVFSGVLDSEGEQQGIALLQECVENPVSGNEECLKSELHRFLQEYERRGYVPRALYFAVQRFHRWYALNRNADFSAQAQTLNELYETYQLQEVEKLYADTRMRFFLDTVFISSQEAVRKGLFSIIMQQHKEKLSQEEIIALISGLQKEFELTEKEKYFLSRLSYPHIRPTDSALLISTSAVADVIVKLEDHDGVPFEIRKPVSPKEISHLHQLFLEASLPVHFRPEHRFLVAISERGYIIGGLFYLHNAEQTAHMDKIVVSSQFRRKGISDHLMNEFFNRMRDEKMRYVTTGFFRPEYFYRFGFRTERKYAGLVKDLQEE